MNWVVPLIHFVLVCLAYWGGHWWFLLFITPFFVVSLFFGFHGVTLFFTKLARSLQSPGESRSSSGLDLVLHVGQPAYIIALLLIGVYLLLVSAYSSWVTPTGDVFGLILLSVALGSSGLLMMIERSEYSLSAPRRQSFYDTTFVCLMVTYVLMIGFFVVSLFHQEISLTIMTILLCGSTLLSYGLGHMRWLPLDREQWLLLCGVISLTGFAVVSACHKGVYPLFALSCITLLSSCILLVFASLFSYGKRLHSTMYEIAYYGIIVTVLSAFSLVLFFPEVLIHTFVLLVVSLCGLFFLYQRFHVSQVLFMGIPLFLLTALLMMWSLEFVGVSWYLFFLLLALFLLYGFEQLLSFRLRPPEKLFLIITSIAGFILGSFLYALFFTGFSLFGFALSCIVSGLLLALVYGEIKTLFPSYDLSSRTLFRRR